MKDAVILDIAEKDFWQIAVQRRRPLERSGLVLFRVHPAALARAGALVRAFVEANAPSAGHVSMVTVDGIQMVAAGRK
jgi:hypothetical protein